MPLRRRAEAYAQFFDRMTGDPRGRVRRIAARYGVRPQSVLNALRRFWGPRRFREEIPALPLGRKPGPRSPAGYVGKYESLTGSPAERVRRIARSFRVHRSSVRAMLKRVWGAERYREEMGYRRRVGSEELVRLLNEKRASPGGPVVAVAAELGIKTASLQSRMSRRRIRRTPNGYRAGPG